MIDQTEAVLLLSADQEISSQLLQKIAFVGFENPRQAVELLRESAQSGEQLETLAEILPGLLFALSETTDPDRSLRNFQRYLCAVENRDVFFKSMIDTPRSIEILFRLFVDSQYMTEILLRQPHYLERLTQHRRLAAFKSREDFICDARESISTPGSIQDLKQSLRMFHQWEILRIAACDSFGLMDIKTVTLQLSLLADAVVQTALENLFRLEGIHAGDFAVIAFGKLGGLELNYSSDIDLVFICQGDAERFASVGQKLIQVLSDFTSSGFLYRVDMRLRPWGNSGPLVTTSESYAEYFQTQAQLWERQALLKARTIAGQFHFGDELLDRLKHSAFDVDPEEVRLSIQAMKDQIEKQSGRNRQHGGSVKGRPGGIRDIEFLVQYLQFIHGDKTPSIRRVGTLDGLIYLSEANLIHAQEFRTLSTAYVILRTIEHSLQVMHNQSEYFLPESDRELAYLARRLDFPDAEQFLLQYEQHTSAVKAIFDRHLRKEPGGPDDESNYQDLNRSSQNERSGSETANRKEAACEEQKLLRRLNKNSVVAVHAEGNTEQEFDLLIVGIDHFGSLPIICGLLLAHGFDVISGTVETLDKVKDLPEDRKYVNRFHVRWASSCQDSFTSNHWKLFEKELHELLLLSISGENREAQKLLIRRLVPTLRSHSEPLEPLLPVDISFDQDAKSNTTILKISGEDDPGFLFELTNAISMNGLSIERMLIRSKGTQIFDTLHVIDPADGHLLNESQRNRLRATVVLIKHFTHLLPHAPNPETALIHFRGLLTNLFEQSDWLDQLQTLQQPEVLAALARLLGGSDFLWEDFLRLQHQNLFPVVTDLSGLQQPRTREELSAELTELLASSAGRDSRVILNEFKDRAMMRVDMRHIMGLQTAFGMFSMELTAVAETIVQSAIDICSDELNEKYGIPTDDQGGQSRLSVCALGKCGGRELGYASDIELMFLYDKEGHTTGPQRISNIEYFQQLVEKFQSTIFTREKRIFEIDLRLRPYGNAGSLAVSRNAFENYFKTNGPAWPFERQALVKLRPIAGDSDFGEEIVELRDRLIFVGKPFDLAAMRALREKQIRKFVQPGTFHAKLSPGGLVECEYLVQGLQLTFGHLDSEIRTPNTREAMKALEKSGILSSAQRIQLRDAYRFLRRLIDGMRMVRGDATDLTVPHFGTEQFEFLAKRLGLNGEDLHQEIERQTCQVIECVFFIEELITGSSSTNSES